jgi:hypothetical protein
MWTIEDLVHKTQYTKNTIYTLSVALDIKPIRGKVPGIQSKGLYPEEALQKLWLYKGKIDQGLTKEEAIKYVNGAYA